MANLPAPFPPASPAPPPRWVRPALAALFVWSLVVRVWFASVDLVPGRFWDERYPVSNVRALLLDGNARPASFDYQTLSYLPQAALLAAVQGAVRGLGRPGYSLFERRRLSREGYLLCRLLVVVYGMLSLWLTYRLGRRLFSAEIGAIATLALAAMPLHIRLSTFFKPDALLLLLVLLAAGWGLDALEEPGRRRYLLAGAGVGLAMSAKLTGGLIALPLAAGSLLAGWRGRRQWALLGAAGLAAAGVFVALNPWLAATVAALRYNLWIYERKAGPRLGEAGWGRLADVGEIVLRPGLHGVALGTCALIGLAALAAAAVIAWRRRVWRGVAAGLVVCLFPLGFTFVYVAVTRFVKPNNFLPVFPMTAMAIAWLLSTLWAAARERLPALRRPLAGAVPFVAVAALTLPVAQGFVYTVVTRSTWQRALITLRAEHPEPDRRVYAENPPPRLRWAGTYRRVQDLSRLPAGELACSDAEVFPERRLEGGGGAFYRGRLAEPGARVRHWRPRLFHTRGEPLVVVEHPRRAGAC